MGNVIKSKSACSEIGSTEQAIDNKVEVKCPIECPSATNSPERRNCVRQRGKPERLRKTTNPFLIFFLRLKSRQPNVHVAKLARVAGERWQCMNCEERKKYVDLAEAEKKRRQGRRCTRRAQRNWPKRTCKRTRGSKIRRG